MTSVTKNCYSSKHYISNLYYLILYSSAATDPFRGLENLISIYDYLMSLSDPRVENWPLMASPWPTICTTMAYLLFVHWGPIFMADRKPLEIRPLILLYNAAVAGLNLYIGLELTFTSKKLDFSWICEPVDYSNDPLAIRVASALW